MLIERLGFFARVAANRPVPFVLEIHNAHPERRIKYLGGNTKRNVLPSPRVGPHREDVRERSKKRCSLGDNRSPERGFFNLFVYKKRSGGS